MARATGIGGVLLRAQDPDALKRWYAENLGLSPADGGPIVLRWRELGSEREALTVFGLFAADTDYFGSRDQQAMLNFRVDDLDALLADLRAGGVPVEGDIGEEKEGRFAWVSDPEGNRVELWEPAGG